MKNPLHRAFLLGCALFCAGTLQASSFVNDLEHQDFDLETSTPGWAQSPSTHHRLFLDVYNVTDFYDFETTGAADLFPSRTTLADTLRPTLTLLWDSRWRIQLGVIAERAYGDNRGFGKVDPWIQLLWKPIKPLDVVFGNLHTPHYYVPALFYPTYYVETRTNETGAQVMFQRENWYDDLFFDYYRTDNADHNEKFDWGFVHRNSWKILNITYQAHWVHEGGEINIHPYNTVNDVAQVVGGGLQHRVLSSLIVGTNYLYFHSHYQRESTITPSLNRSNTGDGSLLEGYIRYRRIKAIYGNWRGHHFEHEGGDPMFRLPVMSMVSLRWDILQGREFNLLAEYTGYFIGNNNQNYNRYLKSAFHIQASWQFSIPIIEWDNPVPTPEGPPVPSRWDYGI